MAPILAALPILAVVVVLALGRPLALAAGVGLATTLALVLAIPPAGADALAFLAGGVLRGTWTSWSVISIIITGLFFFQVLRNMRPDLFAQEGRIGPPPTPARLFAICFLLGPFTESATGFGVGYVLTLAALVRMGIDPIRALPLGLFSQTLVPWGALAVGTYIGADLAGIPVEELGAACALVTAPLLLAYLPVFWRLARGLTAPPSVGECCVQVATLLACAALLYLGNRHVAVELAGVLATGLLLVAHVLREPAEVRGPWGRLLAVAAPYLGLTLLLLATRVVPGAPDWLRGLLTLAPGPGYEPYPVLYHPSFWLLVAAVGYGLLAGSAPSAAPRWGTIPRQLGQAAWRPCLVTLLFLVMADWMVASGMIESLARGAIDGLGAWGVLTGPLLAGVGGFLTASNAASNAMLINLQVAMATQAGLSVILVAAVQNTVGSAFTLLSPIRISMGLGFLGRDAQASALYRRMLPFAVVVLTIGLGTLGVAFWLS